MKLLLCFSSECCLPPSRNEEYRRHLEEAQRAAWARRWKKLIGDLVRATQRGPLSRAKPPRDIVFDCVLHLYAHEDFDGVLRLLAETYELAPTAVRFYVPQLANFLLRGNMPHPERLEALLLDKCEHSLHFAHRLYFFLSSYAPGAHYTSDLCAGALVGSAAAGLVPRAPLLRAVEVEGSFSASAMAHARFLAELPIFSYGRSLGRGPAGSGTGPEIVAWGGTTSRRQLDAIRGTSAAAAAGASPTRTRRNNDNNSLATLSSPSPASGGSPARGAGGGGLPPPAPQLRQTSRESLRPPSAAHLLLSPSSRQTATAAAVAAASASEPTFPSDGFSAVTPSAPASAPHLSFIVPDGAVSNTTTLLGGGSVSTASVERIRSHIGAMSHAADSVAISVFNGIGSSLPTTAVPLGNIQKHGSFSWLGGAVATTTAPPPAATAAAASATAVPNAAAPPVASTHSGLDSSAAGYQFANGPSSSSLSHPPQTSTSSTSVSGAGGSVVAVASTTMVLPAVSGATLPSPTTAAAAAAAAASISRPDGTSPHRTVPAFVPLSTFPSSSSGGGGGTNTTPSPLHAGGHGGGSAVAAAAVHHASAVPSAYVSSLSSPDAARRAAHRAIMDALPPPPDTPAARLSAFHDTPAICAELTRLSYALMPLLPETRNAALRSSLASINARYLPSRTAYVPVGNVHHRLLAIHPVHSFCFKTKERVPYMVVLEVVDYANSAGGPLDESDTEDDDETRDRAQKLHAARVAAEKRARHARLEARRALRASGHTGGGGGAPGEAGEGGQSTTAGAENPASAALAAVKDFGDRMNEFGERVSEMVAEKAEAVGKFVKRKVEQVRSHRVKREGGSSSAVGGGADGSSPSGDGGTHRGHHHHRRRGGDRSSGGGTTVPSSPPLTATADGSGGGGAASMSMGAMSSADARLSELGSPTFSTASGGGGGTRSVAAGAQQSVRGAHAPTSSGGDRDHDVGGGGGGYSDGVSVTGGHADYYDDHDGSHSESSEGTARGGGAGGGVSSSSDRALGRSPEMLHPRVSPRQPQGQGQVLSSRSRSSQCVPQLTQQQQQAPLSASTATEGAGGTGRARAGSNGAVQASSRSSTSFSFLPQHNATTNPRASATAGVDPLGDAMMADGAHARDDLLLPLVAAEGPSPAREYPLPPQPGQQQGASAPSLGGLSTAATASNAGAAAGTTVSDRSAEEALNRATYEAPPMVIAGAASTAVAGGSRLSMGAPPGASPNAAAATVPQPEQPAPGDSGDRKQRRKGLKGLLSRRRVSSSHHRAGSLASSAVDDFSGDEADTEDYGDEAQEGELQQPSLPQTQQLPYIHGSSVSGGDALHAAADAGQGAAAPSESRRAATPSGGGGGDIGQWGSHTRHHHGRSTKPQSSSSGAPPAHHHTSVKSHGFALSSAAAAAASQQSPPHLMPPSVATSVAPSSGGGSTRNIPLLPSVSGTITSGGQYLPGPPSDSPASTMHSTPSNPSSGVPSSSPSGSGDLFPAGHMTPGAIKEVLAPIPRRPSLQTTTTTTLPIAPSPSLSNGLPPSAMISGHSSTISSAAAAGQQQQQQAAHSTSGSTSSRAVAPVRMLIGTPTHAAAAAPSAASSSSSSSAAVSAVVLVSDSDTADTGRRYTAYTGLEDSQRKAAVQQHAHFSRTGFFESSGTDMSLGRDTGGGTAAAALGAQMGASSSHPRGERVIADEELDRELREGVPDFDASGPDLDAIDEEGETVGSLPHGIGGGGAGLHSHRSGAGGSGGTTTGSRYRSGGGGGSTNTSVAGSVEDDSASDGTIPSGRQPRGYHQSLPAVSSSASHALDAADRVSIAAPGGATAAGQYYVSGVGAREGTEGAFRPQATAASSQQQQSHSYLGSAAFSASGAQSSSSSSSSSASDASSSSSPPDPALLLPPGTVGDYRMGSAAASQHEHHVHATASAAASAPSGVPLPPAGASAAAGPEAKPLSIVFAERWKDKEAKVAAASPFSHLPGWRLMPVIVKANDDLRQEQFVSQLMQQFAQIFRSAGVPVWLRAYDILATEPRGGIIQAVSDTVSLDSLKRGDANFSTLDDWFERHFNYGLRGLERVKAARYNFVRSMAGYSVVCYLLNIKDRHNGNILIDRKGHIVHIDFGFLLTSSPGGNINFEAAPFKLTAEFVEAMGGARSSLFVMFRKLCIRAFLAARKYRERIILQVEMMLSGNSDLGCFRGGPAAVVGGLRARFHESANERGCVNIMHSLIDQSIDSWRSRWYDRYQRFAQGIM